MAPRFIDGCSHYDVILDKYADKSSGMKVSTQDAQQPHARRAGSHYLYTTAVESMDYVDTKPLYDHPNRLVVGTAVKICSALCSGGITICDGTAEQVTLYWDTDQRLIVKRGDYNIGVTLAQTGTGFVPIGTWFYLEFEAVIHDTAGTTEVHFNGEEVEDLTLSGVDTRPGSESAVTHMRLLGSQTNCFTDIWTDVYNFHGDCLVDLIMPNGAGEYAQWDPSAGANWENVDDDEEIDGDETYNASTLEGDKDCFTFGNLINRPASAIIAVAINLAARKDDEATRVLKPLVRVSETNHLSGNGITLGSDYEIAQEILPDCPDDWEDWEEADVNNAEFGYQQFSVT